MERRMFSPAHDFLFSLSEGGAITGRAGNSELSRQFKEQRFILRALCGEQKTRMNISQIELEYIIPGNCFDAVRLPARSVGAIRMRANPRKLNQFSLF